MQKNIRQINKKVSLLMNTYYTNTYPLGVVATVICELKQARPALFISGKSWKHTLLPWRLHTLELMISEYKYTYIINHILNPRAFVNNFMGHSALTWHRISILALLLDWTRIFCSRQIFVVSRRAVHQVQLFHRMRQESNISKAL